MVSRIPTGTSRLVGKTLSGLLVYAVSPPYMGAARIAISALEPGSELARRGYRERVAGACQL